MQSLEPLIRFNIRKTSLVNGKTLASQLLLLHPLNRSSWKMPGLEDSIGLSKFQETLPSNKKCRLNPPFYSGGFFCHEGKASNAALPCVLFAPPLQYEKSIARHFARFDCSRNFDRVPCS